MAKDVLGGGSPARPDRYQALTHWVGGMGRVYVCLDRDTGREVAVKMVKYERDAQTPLRQRFLEEAANWIYLGRHPNIVQAHRVEQWGRPPRPGLVLELVSRGRGYGDASLAGRLQRGRPMPFRRALAMGLDIARGMVHATRRIPGLVHRDLKPGNILYGDDGCFKITDFGIACSYRGIDPDRWMQSRAGRQAAPESAPGTPRYRAPEQCDPLVLLDPRADIYALGCILYEALTCQYALPGDRPDALLRRQRAGGLPMIPEGLPEPIAELIRRCMAPDRDERFADWGEVEAALCRVYQSISHERAPPPRPGAAGAGESPGDRLTAAESYIAIAASHLELGQYDLAGRFLERVVAIAREQSQSGLEARGLKLLALVHGHRGEFAAALGRLEEAACRARAARDYALAGEAVSLQGVYLLRSGDRQSAATRLEEAVELAEASIDDEAAAVALGNLGNFHAETGEPDKAFEYFQRVLGLAATSGDQGTESRCRANMGAAQLATGALQEARANVEKALQLAEHINDPVGRCHAARLLCQVYRRLGRPRLALASSERYLEAVEQGGSLREMMDANVQVARCRKRLGHGRLARRHLDRARALRAGSTVGTH